MSRRIKLRKTTVAMISQETAAICELCGKTAELRPYGPSGERICFECGKQNEATTKRQMARELFGVIIQ